MNSIPQYRSRVIWSLIFIQLFAIYFVLMNPNGDLNFWARHTIGYNDFLWYIIGSLTLVVVFLIAHLLEKALFYGLGENS